MLLLDEYSELLLSASGFGFEFLLVERLRSCFLRAQPPARPSSASSKLLETLSEAVFLERLVVHLLGAGLTSGLFLLEREDDDERRNFSRVSLKSESFLALEQVEDGELFTAEDPVTFDLIERPGELAVVGAVEKVDLVAADVDLKHDWAEEVAATDVVLAAEEVAVFVIPLVVKEVDASDDLPGWIRFVPIIIIINPQPLSSSYLLF